MMVRYERLVQNPLEEAERMFKFCHLPFRQEVADFIAKSQARFDPRPYSIFKGNRLCQDWRSEFPDHILHWIENETKKAGLGMYLL